MSLFVCSKTNITMKTIFIPTDEDEEFSDDEWGIEENEW